MRSRVNLLLTACQIFYQISALSLSKNIYFPPESSDQLYLGCYERQNNESDFYQPSHSILSSYRCIEACAHETFPLAAVFNATQCHCANESVIPLIKTVPCGGSSNNTSFRVYNTSCLLVEVVEIYQELTFTRFPSKITSSVASSVIPVTTSSVTVSNSSKPIVYSVDFGDDKSNTTWQHSVFRHHYVNTGEFNITLVASRSNSTIFVLSRKFRVLSRAKVAGMSCPAVKPYGQVDCTLNDLRGSDITASIALHNTNQTVSVLVPDAPRVVIENTGLPLFNQSDAKNEEPGTYLLPSLHFTTETLIEAWELYAEYPGIIQLQIYRAALNLTNCTKTWQSYSSCEDWTPPSGQCNEVCVKLKYSQKLSIMSCRSTLSSYSKVYSMEANLTAGYNLIVTPEEARFVAREGDIVGVYRNTSGAAIQRTSAGQDTGVYFYPARLMSNLTMELKNGVGMNVSFRVRLHSSIIIKAVLTVSCFKSVGLYSMMTSFSNAISPYNSSLAFRSLIAVQNPILKLTFTYGGVDIYVKVNTTKDITATVTQGTNVSCEWYVPNSSITVQQSPYLDKNNTTEGGVFQYSSLFRYAGFVPIVVTVSNLVSRVRKDIIFSVRESIEGLNVHMCHGEFAYDNALTCYLSSVTRGTSVGCTWVFTKGYTVKPIGKAITHRLTPAGNRNFTLHCYNKISISSLNYFVNVIDNPLSIDIPLKVPANELIKITCQVNWPGGNPNSFFAKQGVGKQKGTDIVADPILTLKARDGSNSSTGPVILYMSFKRNPFIKHKVTCGANNYPDFNIIRLIKAIDRITGINVTIDCPFRVEVGRKCTFQVQISAGDQPEFAWTVSESDNPISMYSGRTIQHRFFHTGLANITVNVSNEVSSLEKTTFVFVSSDVTQWLRVTTSPFVQPSSTLTSPPAVTVALPSSTVTSPPVVTVALPSTTVTSPLAVTVALPSSTMTSPLAVTVALPSSTVTSPPAVTVALPSTFSENAPGHSFPGTKSILPTSPITSYSTTGIQISSLKDAQLRHASAGLVGHAISFTVDHVQKPHLFRFIWTWDDHSAFEEGNFTITHTFNEPGKYFVSVNISSEVHHVVLRGHVTVQYPIKGVLIRDLAAGPSNVLLMKFEILQGTNVTYSVEYGDGTDTQVGFLQMLLALVEVTHQYSEPGKYLLSIEVNSIVGPRTSIQRSVIIGETACVIDELRMFGAGGSSIQYTEIQQGYDYSLYPSLKVNCQALEELKYEWKVEGILNDSITETVPFPKEILSSNVLFLAARSLKSGLYKFTLSVTATPLGVSKSASGFLLVRMPELLVVIDCGSKRVMPWNHEIVLNASSSRDPNDVEDGKAIDSLSFEWFCDSNRDLSCFNGSIDNRKSVLKFPPKFLDLNGSYTFVVVISRGKRQAKASQSIEVVSGDFLPLCVRCSENCAHKLTISKKFVLTGEGCQDNDNTPCRWELYGPPPSKEGISKRSIQSDSQLISVSYSTQFQLDPSNLIPNKTYTIFFNNEDSGFSAEYSVITDLSPTGGSCVVSPLEGVVIETQFRISCAGWTDEDSPLWYEFFLRHPVHGPMLLFYGWMPDSVGLFLPPGLKENNFNVDLFVKITDVLGSYRIVPLQVKVKGFSPDAGSVSSILKGIVSGPDSMLEKLLSAGEFQQATQLMTTAITVLNEDSSQVHEPDSPDTKNRMEVRSRVITGLSRMCCSSPQGIQQALGGLLQAIGLTTELSPDALVDGANALTNMARALVVKFKNVRAANETRGIINGLNIIMETSVSTSNEVKREQNSDEIKDWIDDSNEARNKEHQEKCERATNKSLKGVNYAAQKILDYQRKGDPPRHVNSGLMKMTLTRQSPSDIDDAALNGGEVTFQFPTEVKEDKLKQFGTVNTKVITMSQTPFISNDAIPIDTPVSTLELLETSGKEIEIRDLAEPVSIFLSLNQSESKDLNNMTGVTDSLKNITFFKIESGEHSSLYFTMSCSGEMNVGQELVVVIKRNTKPTSKDFDIRWTLASCNTTLKKLISRKYLNNSEGLYLGVKLLDASNVTNGTSVLNEIQYKVAVKAIGCYYWNENIQAWRTDGCEVGPLTTLERIHCQCNHLTWFGSRVFVPPNKLHMDVISVRIKDPSNYVPVLTVLCVTFGVYFLVLVWARREDRKDRNKTGFTVSSSNRPGDAHAYEVIICTGMRRHAGTTANVAMTITGEHGESHAILLKNSQRMTLARGSIDSFLVTTSETLGELAYIRVWHDNFGKDPAWFVKLISIREIDTGGEWHFVCESWLAVDEGDGMIDRIFPVTSSKELKEFRRLFLTKAYKDLTDSHLWFSVVWRPPQSPFTRVQRVSCCLSLLLCTMMANAMWYQADSGRYTAVELGPFEFSWEQVSIGICSSLIVFPINLVLVQIFRHCRPRPVTKRGCCQAKIRPRSSSTQTEITMVRFGSGQGSTLNIHSLTSQYQNVHKLSPEELLKSRKKRPAWASIKRPTYLRSFAKSLGAEGKTDSTNDIRSLIAKDSPSLSPDLENIASEGEIAREKGLPWWFVYVGWVLVVITSLAAASVTLLYGIQFGLRKSTQWLLSMFFSLTQDIFVSQPLKVVAFAIFFAYIFKKRKKATFSSPSRLRPDENWLQNQLHSEEDSEERPEVPSVQVPTEDTLERARDRAQKERAMHNILLDIGTFLVFTFLVLLIAYGFRDKDAFRQNDAVAKVLLHQNFSGKPEGFKPDRYSQIIRQKDMWDWTENALLPSLYNLPSYFYTGKAPKFMEGESGLVVGVARLRQHRAKRDSCSVAPQVQDVMSKCVAGYSMTSEDEQAYTAGWESFLNITNTQTQTSSPDPWRFSSASELNGYPYMEGIETYSGGGYVLELSHIYYKAVRQVKDAKAKLWLDRYTRSLFMEFTLYNPNSNLFCAVTFLMETLPTGGVYPRAEFLAYRLYRYVGDFQLFILACEVFFFAFVLYFTYREAKKLYRTRRKYFAEVWNLMDLAVLILCWIAISYYFICLGIRKWTIHLYHKNPTKFISFQYLSAWQLMFESVVGVTVFVTCLKFIKLFRFNRRIFLLSCTLKQASGELMQYLLVFGINFLAFSQIYHFLLGSSHDSFSSLHGSMLKLLSVLLGKFSYSEMISSYKVLGSLIFFVYILVTNFLFLNVLIAIIIESFKVVKRQNDKMQNEFEMLDFIIKRFKDVLGMRTLDKPADVRFSYTNNVTRTYKRASRKACADKHELELTESLEQALDRLECYIDVENDIENEDDMLCCYISNKIHHGSSKKAMPSDYLL